MADEEVVIGGHSYTWERDSQVTPPRKSILIEAEEIINGSRHEECGSVRENWGRTVAIFKAWTGIDMSVPNALRFMICVKMGRDGHGYKRDHFVDMAGYEELLDREECDDGTDL